IGISRSVSYLAAPSFAAALLDRAVIATIPVVRPPTPHDFHGTVEVVTAVYEELPFSEFLHRPAAVADRLDSVRALRLRRRGAGDLALTRADQLEQDAVVIDFTARLLAGLVRTQSPEAVRRVLGEALPWVSFLPEDDVDQLLGELIEVAQGAASLENLSPVAVLLAQWRHTAEIHADPTLLEILTREPTGDLGPVPAPEVRQ
ncbi:hypothetical protein, partial [Micromonospora sp. Rc5]|uniref:hypothetical protein n=1 Tax=Micromonospora sp. Rc5 TaxID=1920666 RepID=UPI001E384B85